MLVFVSMDFAFTSRGRGVPGRAAGVARREPAEVPRRLGRRRRPGRRPRGRSSGVARSQERRKDWQRRLNEGRWAAINWPKDWGGREATPVQNVIYSEEMARVRAPGIYNANGIWQIGPDDHQLGHRRAEAAVAARHPRRADEHWCQGFSEPEAGSDLANLRTTAIRDGDEYVVNGQKIWISTAHLAEWGLFLLRTDPDGDRARRQARGHHRVHHRHGDAGHRVPPDPRHRRRRDVQRGLVHRRAHPGRLPARRRRAGLAGRDGHARPRARRHRRPRDHDGGRPAVDDLGRARRSTRTRSTTPRSASASPARTPTSSSRSCSTTGR